MNILIVDDDPSVCSILARMIKQWGYTFETCETGKAALVFCKQKPFDVVILDIFLPDGTAHQFIPKIRAINSDIKIIASTGMNTEDLEKEIRGLGILYYLAKPIQHEELKAILEHQIKKIKKS